jgi:hypothetical protein
MGLPKLRNDYVEERYHDILGSIPIDVHMDQLKKLPDFLVEFIGAKERFLNDLCDIERFVELPADIRFDLFESSKPLREAMLERLLPIVLITLGIDKERVIELAQDTKARREFYFGTLFPKVKEITEAVMLKFDEKLVWRIADELFEGVVRGEKVLEGL